MVYRIFVKNWSSVGNLKIDYEHQLSNDSKKLKIGKLYVGIDSIFESRINFRKSIKKNSESKIEFFLKHWSIVRRLKFDY